MALPGPGDLLVILFVLALIFTAGKTSVLADRIGRLVERKGPGTGAARPDGAPAGKAGRPTATPR